MSSHSHADSSWIAQVVSTSPALVVRNVFAAQDHLIEVRAKASVDAGSYVSVRGALLTEVLATPGSARANIYDVMVREGLDPTFPAEVTKEVARLLADPCIDDPALTDLRHCPFVTIDGQHTRDLDQAVWIERKGRGYRVWYALADASFYVRPGTALFEEAIRRGASYYLPGLVVPMLPRALSEHLISLNEGVTRRATVFCMDLDHQGRCVETEMKRACIRSFAKLSFDAVQQFYDTPEESTLADKPFADSLQLLREVGTLRIHEAEERDVIRYRRTEVDVGLEDDEGLRFVVVDDLRREVERYNEQISLLCNTEGARYLAKAEQPSELVQPIYRVHPRPRPERIAEFEALLIAMAQQRGLEPEIWTWRQGKGKSLAAYLKSLPKTGPYAWVAKAIHRQAIMLNLRSSYSEQEGEHYGVGADLYARFSSPMREIVGVFVHKEAWEQANGGPLPPRWGQSTDKLPDDNLFRTQIVKNANRSKDVQKNLDRICNRLVIDRMFARDLAKETRSRPARCGTVMGLTKSKAYILLDSPHLDVKVYASHVGRQYQQSINLDPQGASWLDSRGEIFLQLGDRVVVKLTEREERGRRWVMDLQIDGASR